MSTFLPVFLIILVVFGLSFVMINLRHVLTGQEFRGSCSSNNSLLKTELGDCSVCGKKEGEMCKMPEPEK